MDISGRPVAGGRVVAVLGVLLVVALAGGYGFAVRAKPRSVPLATIEPTPEAGSEGPSLYIHVAGEVVAPGLYRLPSGARVDDAVSAAGGPTPDADLDTLNLAAKLSDGDKVVVAGRGDAASDESGTGASGRIDLNRADSTALQTLPGIGPALAERIIAYRDEHGGFRAVRDLLKVSGIGPRTFERLEELVTV